MKNREEIFLATARTFSENPKIKISFKKEDRKNEEFSLNEININNKIESLNISNSAAIAFHYLSYKKKD